MYRFNYREESMSDRKENINFNLYEDIKKRTNGEIYLGVVGPVRTGKSTFVKRFMDLCVIPEIADANEKQRTIDELPQSSAGSTIMTTEPKFIPGESAAICMADDIKIKVRAIDCVGFMVDGAMGAEENGKERMVNTPWSKDPVPFSMAAQIGTEKVIEEHSTIGIVITTDGSFTGIERDNYVNAEQKLQDLSSNEEMSLEDKMKKRQEIQQEINNLNQQLRQHQIEQRNKQQSKNSSSMDDMVAGTSNTSKKKDTGLSQASMQAMISADSSMKQAKVQGSMATQIQGRASVLESEIKQDAGKGNTEKKEEELAELQAKAQSATAAQMSTLADANKSVEEAAKAENSNTEDTATKNNTDKSEKTQESAGAAAEETDSVKNTDIKGETQVTVETPTLENAQNATQQAVYTPIDIRL